MEFENGKYALYKLCFGKIQRVDFRVERLLFDFFFFSFFFSFAIWDNFAFFVQ